MKIEKYGDQRWFLDIQSSLVVWWSGMNSAARPFKLLIFGLAKAISKMKEIGFSPCTVRLAIPFSSLHLGAWVFVLKLW